LKIRQPNPLKRASEAMMATTNNILIAAVGGQGALLAARVFGNYAEALGLDVKVSEIHGMSQRGGSVVTHVRFGNEVHSPVIEAGTVDAVLAFEQLEAARYVGMLRKGGVLVVNTQRIQPLPVLTGAATYPTDLLERLAPLPISTIVVDALIEAQGIGNAKTVNTILLGAYAGHLRSDPAPWHRAIDASVRPAHRDINLLAFDRGYAMTAASAPS
jgi:indolepyruvate ferredoxin oxidoreductase beta subunit